MAVSHEELFKSSLRKRIIDAKFPNSLLDAARADLINVRRTSAVSMQELIERRESFVREIDAKTIGELQSIGKQILGLVTIEEAANKIAEAIRPTVEGYPQATAGRPLLVLKYRDVLLTLAFNGRIKYVNAHDLLPLDPATFSDKYFPLNGLVSKYSLRDCLLVEHCQHAERLPTKANRGGMRPNSDAIGVEVLSGLKSPPGIAIDRWQIEVEPDPAAIDSPSLEARAISAHPTFPNAPASIESQQEPPYRMATAEELIKLFQIPKEDHGIFKRVSNIKGLNDARWRKGVGKKIKPLFDPVLFALWYLDSQPNKRNNLFPAEAIHILRTEFPDAYDQRGHLLDGIQ